MWTKRSFSNKYITKALKSIVDVAFQFLPKETTFESNQNFDNNVGIDLENPVYSDSETTDTFNSMLRSNSREINERNRVSTRSDIELEKIIFLELIKNKNIGGHSTTSFWNKFKSQLPLLSSVARQLLNIPSSGACIERFFSICGVICTQRRGNMSTDMIIKRSMLKVNLDILTEFTNK